MGLTNMVIAILVAFLIGMIPAGIFSEMGRELPLTALIVARHTFGWGGAFVFSIFFTFVNVGWFGLNTEVGGQILSAIFHLHGEFWFWAVGVIQVVLVLFGMKWLEYFYRYTSAILVVCYGTLSVYLFTHFHVRVPQSIGKTPWGGALTTILIFSILSWTYKISTVFRFAVSVQKTSHRTRYFLAPSIGIVLAVLLMGVVGIFSQEATGNWNVALFGSSMPVWGVVAAVGVYQLQHPLRPVQDAHAHPADLLRVVRGCVCGYVAPAEVVRWRVVQSCEGRCHELRYRLGLRFLSVAALGLERPVQGMSQFVEEGIPVFCC
jgi:purine-cytosine permease-like protein